MLRLSLPQNGSILGGSSASELAQGLRSGEERTGEACSCGDLEQLGGGEVEGGGGEVVVDVGVWGVWADVGLLVADWEALVWLRPKLESGPVRSRPPTLAVMGEWRESFRVGTGEEVRDGIDRGGGEENLRRRRGDLSLVSLVPLLFRLVAKNSSNDLKERLKKKENQQHRNQFRAEMKSDLTPNFHVVGHKTSCLVRAGSCRENAQWSRAFGSFVFTLHLSSVSNPGSCSE